ncbi:ImmA/IrrE family metallo-endopeptidase [Paenibacillus thiaminolyticus]|uniref:ImmA/IrrE family metallo-endopeptidase n=1 Tax=Paenibacillus thiaminolyticus TaxID=49283 RepID=UPI001163BFAE|nr:ImmA/IrrE family metallo-endopeptidase [Paenibacillus thiaminolyticus]MDG0876496.1 ImmA/IrrE family metallo-endopeptidase [Paenibacillus thiaminolyticus]NGP62670.1 ImmA/IrrE family metallo-endopeptidase [Paenibacillus thiaminolyticus]WII39666.1 ImmA/IrrE family metallo-endopeptidase [Paenibacillus thiaminolyticus]
MEKQAARKLIKKHGTNSPWMAADNMGIEVVYEDLGKNILGYYTCLNRIPSIHINNRLDRADALFTCAHELGHAVLHPRLSTPFLKRNTIFSIDKIERQANRFAIYFLIGLNKPEPWETKQDFLLRCGLPEEFHTFY